MTIQDIINWIDSHPWMVFGYLLFLIIAALLIVSNINDKKVSQMKYMMSAIVFGVTIPGILALLLSAYSLLMLRSSLLSVSILVYFLPIVAMVVTLTILNKKVHLKQIPGFDRLSGLMVLIAVTFFIMFALQRTYFGVIFMGSIFQLLLVFVVLFLVLKFAWGRLTR